MPKKSKVALCLIAGAVLVGSGCGNDSGGGVSPFSQSVIAPNSNSNTVTFYRAKAHGGAKPRKTIVGANTTLNSPQDIYVDRHGLVYVANDQITSPTPNSNGSIAVFAGSSSSDASPIRNVVGDDTRLLNPEGVTVDAAGQIYVANAGGNTISVYPAGSDGGRATSLLRIRLATRSPSIRLVRPATKRSSRAFKVPIPDSRRLTTYLSTRSAICMSRTTTATA